jgi:hypothetical protein
MTETKSFGKAFIVSIITFICTALIWVSLSRRFYNAPSIIFIIRDLSFFISVVALAASIGSLFGFIITTIFSWRKERREAKSFELDIKKKELEIEKTKIELERMKNEPKIIIKE